MLTALGPTSPEMAKRHLDLREWTERKRVQDLVELGRASDIEGADVCVFAGDAPYYYAATYLADDPSRSNLPEISHRFRRLLCEIVCRRIIKTLLANRLPSTRYEAVVVLAD